MTDIKNERKGGLSEQGTSQNVSDSQTPLNKNMSDEQFTKLSDEERTKYERDHGKRQVPPINE